RLPAAVGFTHVLISESRGWQGPTFSGGAAGGIWPRPPRPTTAAGRGGSLPTPGGRCGACRRTRGGVSDGWGSPAWEKSSRRRLVCGTVGGLLPLVYDELRKLATHKLAHQVPGQTL